MKKYWFRVAGSFEEDAEFDREYYRKMTPKERLSIVQELREIYDKWPKAKGVKRARREGLRRVIKIIQ